MQSAHWHQVAGLKPQIAPEAEFLRHSYRGRVWFVLRSATAAHAFRVSSTARRIAAYMDGDRTVQQIWTLADDRLGDEAPNQDELINLLGQLHGADILNCDITPDVAELFARARRERRGRWLQVLMNPVSIKLMKIDPDRILQPLTPWLRPWWNRRGLLLWSLLVGPAIVLAGLHWTELAANLSDRLIAADNLLLLSLVFMVLKTFHEMGHALAVKVKGGEVHELGVMALVFFPVPYVDASAATAFRSKWERIFVGAAGMMVEVALAALAMFAWVFLEPGLPRSVMFNIMAVAGISTVIFNGNPLLRFDAYYMLADFLEVPNLAARSLRYYGYLFERYFFGLREDSFPQVSAGEKVAYLCYAPLSFINRTVVSIWIILFVAGQYFVFGVVLALWGLVGMLVLPCWKVLRHVLASPRLEQRYVRVRTVMAALLSGLLLLLCKVPVPLRTQTEGVVWMPEEAIVRAATGGFFERLVQPPGQLVTAGQRLLQIQDRDLLADRSRSEKALQELHASYAKFLIEDRVQSDVIKQQIKHEQAALARVTERIAKLAVVSPAAGKFLVPHAVDLPGRYFHQGEVLGYVVGEFQPVVRAVVAQDDIHLVRTATTRIEVRSADQIQQSVIARMIREIPSATAELPSAALAVEGGGTIALDPLQHGGLFALSRYFQFDLAAPLPDRETLIGGRVYVRFSHQAEPLAAQWYRRLRQLFLTRFSV